MTYIVYVMRDASDAVLYVGATVRGEARIREHKKGKPWFAEVTTVEREAYVTAKEASIRERELIALLTPRYNRHDTAYGYAPLSTTSIALRGRKTLGQLAVLWGRSQPTLRQQVLAGVLKAEKFGHIWAVKDEDADAYAREHLGKRGFASPLHNGQRGRPRKPEEPTP